MAIAEQAYIAYAKKLLEEEATGPRGIHRKINKEKIKSFLVSLDKLIAEHPEYQYPPYYKAKLLLAIGDGKDALSAFIPYAKQKPNVFLI